MARSPTTVNWSRVTPHLRWLKVNLDRGLIDPATYPLRLLDIFMEHGEVPSVETAEHYAELEASIGFVPKLMSQLVERVAAKLVGVPDLNLAHSRICDEIADEFDLWDDEDLFPVWLSRVVAGVISDHQEAQHEARACGHDLDNVYPSEVEGGMED